MEKRITLKYGEDSLNFFLTNEKFSKIKRQNLSIEAASQVLICSHQWRKKAFICYLGMGKALLPNW